METFNGGLKSKKKNMKEWKKKKLSEVIAKKTHKNPIQSITTAQECILKPAVAQRGYLVADSRGRAFHGVC